MSKYSTSIKIISYGLALVYILSLIVYAGYFVIPDLRLTTSILVILFAVLFIGALFAAALKEQGRKIMVMGNLVLFLLLFGLDVFKLNMVPSSSSYMILSLIGVLFYSQGKAKILYIESSGGIRKSILIVDDDPSLLKSVKPILLSNGYSVLTAMTGEKGLQIAKRQKPDLILLDVILPGMKGRQVCTKLKDDGDTEKIPVIFLTAKDSPDDVKAEIAVGGIAHITKPFNSSKLLEEIRRVLPS